MLALLLFFRLYFVISNTGVPSSIFVVSLIRPYRVSLNIIRYIRSESSLQNIYVQAICQAQESTQLE